MWSAALYHSCISSGSGHSEDHCITSSSVCAKLIQRTLSIEIGTNYTVPDIWTLMYASTLNCFLLSNYVIQTISFRQKYEIMAHRESFLLFVVSPLIGLFSSKPNYVLYDNKIIYLLCYSFDC